ncbi:MAG: family 20 glycosylhydrolase [Burkholderiales bacterium]|nr:family 20 glycosylhydrolase [Phycisphaerae bacterium]
MRLGAGWADASATVRQVPDARIRPQGYRLHIAGDEISIAASDRAGAFYGMQTLIQLKRLFPRALPEMTIDDYPDYPTRGVMLDISRDKVPTISTLKMIIDELAGLKINHLQLYTEHTFAYREHQVVWKNASPLTPQDISELQTFCRERFIELVPNQNSFGHMERWLKHAPYAELAEAPDGCTLPNGTRQSEPYSICPTDQRSIALLGSLYADLLPNFDSRLFNVGCDETFDLGQPGTRSEALCATRGKHRVYLDFLHQIHGLCGKHRRRMMFWGDIILEAPELISDLPPDAIALEWGYEAAHPFDERLAKLAGAGLAMYVCPGTSTWLSLAGRTDNALGNLASAAAAGLRHGAVGFLNTDWGDFGHLQYWPVSYLPLAYGAGVSWCLDANRQTDIPQTDICQALNRHIFNDPANQTAQILRDLGNVYRLGREVGNSTLLFRILQKPKDQLSALLTPDDAAGLCRQADAIAAIEARVDRLAPGRGDGALIIEELRTTLRLMAHCCARGQWALGDPAITLSLLREQMSQIMPEHHRLWLARNRVGGLIDSAARLAAIAAEYA